MLHLSCASRHLCTTWDGSILYDQPEKQEIIKQNMVWILHCIDALFQSSQVRFSTKILHLPFGPRFIAEIVVLVHLTDMHLQAFQAPGKSKRATWATSQH